MNSRHTVGGAHSVVTPQRPIVASNRFASKRGWLTMKMAAPAFHGAKKQLQACLAQPGEEILRCTSPGCKPEPVHGRERADGIAALAVKHQLGLGRGARGEVQQHRLVGCGRSIRREGFRSIGGLFERDPAVNPGRGADDDPHQFVGTQLGKFCDLVLRRHHGPRTAAIEPILQFVRRQQGGCGDHDHAELDGRQHGLPQRHDVAEQQQQVVATLQPLRAQKIRDLVGASRQRRKGEFRFAVLTGIDDPERGAVAAFGITRQFGIEPVQRPVERHRIGPTEALHRRIVVGAMLQKKRAGILECRHRYFPASPRT